VKSQAKIQQKFAIVIDDTFQFAAVLISMSALAVFSFQVEIKGLTTLR